MEKEIITTTTNEVSETYKTAVQTHQRILANGEICAQSLLEICKDLKKMRDEKLYEEFGYAAFDEYTEKAVGIKPRQAYTYIFHIRTPRSNGFAVECKSRHHEAGFNRAD